MRITGRSMEPELYAGDFVVVRKVPCGVSSRLRPGDLLVFYQPGYGLLVKRLESIQPTDRRLVVAGLHPDSADSRTFGPVDPERVIGRVLWRIHKPR
ncbi:MAG: hypothetical protein GYA17_04570 [Chloroflexi bacterium]|nr:hypothetical protein [Chloroflexota bacterium]